MSKSNCNSNTLLEESSLLYKWTSHEHDSFHNLNEATEIRQALLTWYEENRRKLPWRGDAGPYNGSTAAASKTKVSKGQTDMKSFFSTKATNTKKKRKTESGTSRVTTTSQEEQEAAAEPAINVTGYGVWVSEIMLQQTRVEAVVPYYLKWMKSFPTVHDLANATPEEVNAHWAGLGFYRRARLLHEGAKLVVEEYDGELPQTVDELLKISGIGPYTASAIASIAFNVCVPVVDGNVCRVLSRLAGIANHIKAPILKDKVGWRLAAQILEAGDGTQPGAVNQALMELGATYCAPSGTGLDQDDPLKDYYMSTKLARSFQEQRQKLQKQGYEAFPVDLCLESTMTEPHDCVLCAKNKADVLTAWDESWRNGQFDDSHGPFPLTAPKSSKREEVLAVGAIGVKTGSDVKWLLVRRPEKGLLAGQWEFPAVCVWSSAGDSKKKDKKRKSIEVPFIDKDERSGALSNLLSALLTNTETSPANAFVEKMTRSAIPEPTDHVFSHVRHTMWIEHCLIPAKKAAKMDFKEQISESGRKLRWMTEAEMDMVGVTSGVKKVLKTVITK